MYHIEYNPKSFASIKFLAKGFSGIVLNAFPSPGPEAEFKNVQFN